jgi:hypothetical protein
MQALQSYERQKKSIKIELRKSVIKPTIRGYFGQTNVTATNSDSLYNKRFSIGYRAN